MKVALPFSCDNHYSFGSPLQSGQVTLVRASVVLIALLAILSRSGSSPQYVLSRHGGRRCTGALLLTTRLRGRARGCARSL
jgi:hypothetical protein